MKKSILKAVCIISFLSLFMVPEDLSAWFFLDYAIRCALFALSSRRLDKMGVWSE